jgi:peroxiredoxin
MTPASVATPPATEAQVGQSGLQTVLSAYRTESGRTLQALTEESPVLLIFLRHFGCPFCREALDRVSQARPQLDARGVRPVFVHLGAPERAKPYFDHYQLPDVERVSNPDATLYQHPAFALGRTSPFSHFFRPAVVKAWVMGAFLSYGIGLIHEDGEQMPGVFFLRDGKIANFFRYRTIADQPDYLALIR